MASTVVVNWASARYGIGTTARSAIPTSRPTPTIADPPTLLIFWNMSPPPGASGA